MLDSPTFYVQAKNTFLTSKMEYVKNLEYFMHNACLRQLSCSNKFYYLTTIPAGLCIACSTRNVGCMFDTLLGMLSIQHGYFTNLRESVCQKLRTTPFNANIFVRLHLYLEIFQRTGPQNL